MPFSLEMLPWKTTFVLTGCYFASFFFFLAWRLFSRSAPPLIFSECWADFWESMKGVLFRFFAFGFTGWIFFSLGWSRVYRTGFNWDNALYIAFSFFLYIVLTDYIRYWTHRWMHESRRWYSSSHASHHLSTVVTPLTAFTNPPVLFSLWFSFIPQLLTLVIPVHTAVYFWANIVLGLQIIIQHIGLELVPRKLLLAPGFKQIYFFEHHRLHHERPRSNYGTFFKMWDRWHGTAHPGNYS